MQKKTIIGTLIVGVILAVTLLAFRPSLQTGKESPKKESMDASCQKKDRDGKMIWENLSHQFFSSL